MTKWIAACLSLTCVSTNGLAGEPAGVRVKSPVVAARPAAASKPQFLLRYRFLNHQIVTYRVEQKTTITVAKADDVRVTRNNTVTRKHYSVVAAQQNGSAILEPVLDYVNMSAQFNKQKPRTYDSEKDKTPPKGFYGVARTIGRALVRIKVESDGRLISAIPLLSRKDQAAVVPDKGPKKPSNDAAKNFLIVFPKKSIGVGETWSDLLLRPRLRVGAGAEGLYQEFPIVRTYRLVSVKEDLATIQLESVSLKPLREPGLQVQAAQLLPSATIVFDIRRGFIVSRTSRTEAKVHGGAGPGTLLRVVSDRVEKLVPNQVAGMKQAAQRN